MANFIDITGKKFGKWKVLSYAGGSRWVCLCDCGTESLVYGKTLRNGASTSCGCGKTNTDDLVGRRFGKLIVNKLVSSGSKLRWDCICECGNHVEIASRELLNNKRTTCGKCNEVNVGDIFGRLTVIGIDGIKCVCKCECGEIVETTKYNLLSGKITQCREDRRIEKLKNKYVGNRYGQLVVLDYSHRDKNGYNYWKCRCDCGNEKVISGSSLFKGVIKTCGHRDKLPLHDLTGKVVNEWTFLEYVGNRKWKCKCSCGNIEEVFADNILRGLSKSCGCKGYVSKPEHDLLDFINSLSNYRFIKSNVLDNREIDMYCDELKLGIEYNGSVYHASVNSVYRPRAKNYHQNKFLVAKEKGIHLINVFDIEYKYNKEKIDAYLRDLIIPSFRLYARKCEIKRMDKRVAWEFYDKYHLQNHNTMSQINYGLYYDGNLVACIGFGKLRMKGANREDCYELHRYCVKHGYSIIGGVDRLFKRFRDEYNPNYIKSYSDNNYFSGNMYERMGFKYSGQSSISYYWYLRGNRLKREQCQVKKLKELYSDLYSEAVTSNVSNKEDFIMTQLGACKVYTAGNTIWEFYN